MVIFENEGLIDLDVVRLFGVSIKETNNPIGMFGTGLKYALAVLLRENCRITLYRGLNKHVLSAGLRTVRGRLVPTVQLDGQELSFTLELGRNWQPWQAFRELYCNALDEEGGLCRRVMRAEPREGATLIAVEGDAIEDAYDERYSIVLDPARRPICSAYDVEVYEGASDYIFYRGVRAYKPEHMPQFTYNLLGKQRLTEDRTIDNAWSADTDVAYFVQAAQQLPASVLEQMLLAPPDSYERQLRFSPNYNTSAAFMEIGSQHVHDFTRTSAEMRNVIMKLQQKRGQFAVQVLDASEQQMLDNAVSLLCARDVDIDCYPVVVVRSLGSGILGLAQDRTIYLSYECITRGDRSVVGTLYEEWAHLTFGYRDCTREFQNFLVDRLVAQLCKQQ